jgi:hypothetical protein
MIFKLEEANNPNGGSGIELSHTGSGTWEELCYDFTGLTGSLPPIPAFTVIFDNGVAGAADTNPGIWTFYYDDIEQVESCGDGDGGGGGGDITTLPVSFENDALSYDFGVDGGFEGGAASVIANPQSNGMRCLRRQHVGYRHCDARCRQLVYYESLVATRRTGAVPA